MIRWLNLACFNGREGDEQWCWFCGDIWNICDTGYTYFWDGTIWESLKHLWRRLNLFLKMIAFDGGTFTNVAFQHCVNFSFKSTPVYHPNPGGTYVIQSMNYFAKALGRLEQFIIFQDHYPQYTPKLSWHTAFTWLNASVDKVHVQVTSICLAPHSKVSPVICPFSSQIRGPPSQTSTLRWAAQRRRCIWATSPRPSPLCHSHTSANMAEEVLWINEISFPQLSVIQPHLSSKNTLSNLYHPYCHSLRTNLSSTEHVQSLTADSAGQTDIGWTGNYWRVNEDELQGTINLNCPQIILNHVWTSVTIALSGIAFIQITFFLQRGLIYDTADHDDKEAKFASYFDIYLMWICSLKCNKIWCLWLWTDLEFWN